MDVEFPVIMIDSFRPLQKAIQERVDIWVRRGSKMGLPIIYPYDFDAESLIGKTFKTKRYRVKVEGLKSGSESLLQLKITVNYRRTISEPVYEPKSRRIEYKSISASRLHMKH
jgi:hypothetical protein